MDIFTPEKRAEIMSRIRAKDTKPELMVRRYLFARGFRYRLYRKDLPGRPDIVLPRYRAVIFVHGCFWHDHEACRQGKVPQIRREFWLMKFERNRMRDAAKIEALEGLGWKVFVIWECQLKKKDMSAVDAVIDEMVGGRA